MAAKGGQLGNRNSAKGREWYDAIRKECVQRKALPEIARVLIDKALEGEQWAIQEVGNRIDGKPSQAVELSGPDGDPIAITATDVTALDLRLRELQAQLEAME